MRWQTCIQDVSDVRADNKVPNVQEAPTQLAQILHSSQAVLLHFSSRWVDLLDPVADGHHKQEYPPHRLAMHLRCRPPRTIESWLQAEQHQHR